ncbi:MAG TPA: MarR family transcriptional regulator [Longimicrobiales bacterium]|nr:MarR family transcriptional regulator [Longimicrobiales bacterium]
MKTDDVAMAELAERLHALAIHLLRRVRPADAESGLSAARLSALSVLVFGGAQSMGELAEAEQVSAATMSRLVSGLEAEGLVKRERDRSDGRRLRVSATAAGQRALHAGRARRVVLMSGMLAGLGPGGRASVLEAVEILEARLSSERGEDERQ